MKLFIRIVSVVFTTVMFLAGCDNKQPVETALLELDRTNMKMITGQSQKLVAVLKGSDQELVWSVDKASVAEVEQDGTVTAVAEGVAVVTVSAGDISRQCRVEVIEFRADKLELNAEITNDALVLPAGAEFQIEPRFYKAGEKVNDQAYPVFSLGDAVPVGEGETVATVDAEGLVKAVSAGTVNVTVSGAGLSRTIAVAVKEISLDKESVSLFVKETVRLTAEVIPTYLPDEEKSVSWISSDPEVVKVDASGNVEALKSAASPVEIIAEAGQVRAVCKVTVSDYKANSVEFAGLNDLIATGNGLYEMYIGDTSVQLTAVFKDNSGADVTDKVINLEYSSSDSNVASVSAKGELTPRSVGKTVVTASGAGVQASFELNVLQGVESLEITPSGALNVEVGSDPFDISYTVLPVNASVKDVTFVSDKPEVASVDGKTGKVTIGEEGRARITVTTNGFKRPVKGSDGKFVYENISATLVVTVSRPSQTDVTVSITGGNIVDGVLMLQKNTEVQLAAVVEPESFKENLEWFVTEESVISVDQTGKLRGLSVGDSEVCVNVSHDNQTKMGTLPVKVIGVNPTAIRITNGPKINPAVNDAPVTLVAEAAAPSDADFGGVNWYSSDEKIVKVDGDGKLQYLGIGSAVVTAVAKTWDGSSELSDVKATIEVVVANTKVVDFDLIRKAGGYVKDGKLYVEEGATMQLSCSTVPRGSLPETVSWRTSDSGTATVSGDGVVTGVHCEILEESDLPGTEVSITCVVNGEIERSLTICVIKVQPKDITVTLPGRTLKVGEEWDLQPTVHPDNIGHVAQPLMSPMIRNGIFSSETPGNIRFGFYVSRDETMIYDLTRYFSIDVEPYWVTSVSIPSSLSMDVGSSTSFTPEFTSDVNGIKPTYTDVKWYSSDPAVVSVNENSGVMTAHKAGEADITVSTSGEWTVPSGSAPKTAVCKVTVTQAENPVKVGDYVYSDGTWSTELDKSKTPVAVVFALVNATGVDPQLKKDFANCTHGLAVSLDEYKSALSMKNDIYSFSKVYDFASEGGEYVDMSNTSIPCGYSNTSAMRAFKAAKGDYSIYLDVLDSHNVQVEGASMWYLPSQYELYLLGSQFSLVNSKIADAGKTKFETYKNAYPISDRLGVYWCSTQLDGVSQSKPYILSDNRVDDSMKMISYEYKMRFVIAF